MLQPLELTAMLRPSLFKAEVELDVVEDGKGDHEGDRPCEVSIHIQLHVIMNKYIHEYIQAGYMLAYIHAITHARTHARTHAHTHTHRQTHSHTEVKAKPAQVARAAACRAPLIQFMLSPLKMPLTPSSRKMVCKVIRILEYEPAAPRSPTSDPPPRV